MAVVKKKCWPEMFDLLYSGKKKFDLRLGDFEVGEGDTVRFEEWDPKTGDYTGRVLEKKVTYVMKADVKNLFTWSKEEIEEKGLLVMSLE